MTTTIEVAKDFSDVPAGRLKKDGPASGEGFRELLLAKLRSSDKVDVVLDGAEGYGSSFLEEAFGGLVRLGLFTADELKKRLNIIARSEPFKIYVTEIWGYIERAKRR